MLAVCIGYQQVENYVLQPTIQGRAADISGFFVIASVIVGAAAPRGRRRADRGARSTASAQIVIRELTAERRAAVALAHAAPTPTTTGARRVCLSRRMCRRRSADAAGGRLGREARLLRGVAALEGGRGGARG